MGPSWIVCAFFTSWLRQTPSSHLFGLLRVAIGVMPVSGILGFVTPMLLDRWSGGDPDRAGSGYAIKHNRLRPRPY